MINARIDFADLRVLDLFAGTGALGLEALSRGAAEAVFVDQGRVAQGLIRANIAKLGVGARAELISADVRRMPRTGQPCELIFLDPPYGKALGGDALAAARQAGWVSADALIVWEERDVQGAEGFTELTHRRYGDSVITLLEPNA